MGADLYIESIRKQKRAMYEVKLDEAVKMRDSRKPPYDQEYQELVEYYFDKMYAVGYYRDSYNRTNLVWLFEFSYWQNDLQLNGEGDLPPSEAKRWLGWLKEHESVFEANLQKLELIGDESREEVNSYFRTKYGYSDYDVEIHSSSS